MAVLNFEALNFIAKKDNSDGINIVKKEKKIWYVLVHKNVKRNFYITSNFIFCNMPI